MYNSIVNDIRMDVNKFMIQTINIDHSEVTGNLESLLPLTFIIVDQTDEEAVWDEMMKKYHYLGYRKMIGQRIKYLIKSGNRPVAAISYNRSANRVAARDEYIGWNEEKRLNQLKYVISNNRFLIPPWIHVKNLASYVLALSLKRVRIDWEDMYGTKPMIVETFIDTSRYTGTCYKAANWICAGETKGYGKVGKSYEYHGNKKAVYLYILDHRYNKKLDMGSQPKKPKSIKIKEDTKFPTPSQLRKREERRMLLGIPDWDEKLLADCGLSIDAIEGLGDKLEEYLNGFAGACANSKQMDLITVYEKGLFSDLERKSVEPIALRYNDKTGVRNLQIFFKQGKVSQEALLKQHRLNAIEFMCEENGMANVDGSDFPKKGGNSVGVARQHCGILGKTENCQAGVFAGYSGSRGYAIMDRRLYMPQKWFGDDYADRREDCEVPKDLTFKTKNELALEMLKDMDENGVPFQWIGCDSAFGSDRGFLANLPTGRYYFADIKETQLVFLNMPQMIAPQKKEGRGRKQQYPRPSVSPVHVKSIAENPDIPWQTTFLGEGSKGPISTQTKCLRVIRTAIGSGGPKCATPLDEVWLYIRKYENDRIKYSFSNAPFEIDRKELDRAATMRWPIEQCFNECKSYLGMDHYESRSWNAWHLHMVLVMIAQFFTLILRYEFKRHTPVLSMPMTKKLICASITKSVNQIVKALKNVEYHLRRNAIAYRSHRSKKLNSKLILI